MRQFSGVCSAVVVDNVDPDNSGRVQVRLPPSIMPGQESLEAWARIATLMAGNHRGTWFIPDVNDEVLVAFEGGDVRRPYVIGALWSGTNPPPETMDADNTRKVVRSRGGVTVVLDDRGGEERFVVETPGGQKVVLKDGPGSVQITDSNGNSVKLEPSGVTVNASAKCTINAGAVEINSSILTLSAAMSKFSGVVQCDTLISNSVVSASYTPSAGNVW